MADLIKKVRVNPWFVSMILIYLVVTAIYINSSRAIHSCEYVYVFHGSNIYETIFGIDFVVLFPGLANGLMFKGSKNKLAKILSSNLLLFLINMASTYVTNQDFMGNNTCSYNFFLDNFLANYHDEVFIFGGLCILSSICSLLISTRLDLNRTMKSLKDDNTGE